MLELLRLFPSELLEAELSGDLKRERRLILRLLGKYLVYGWSVVDDSFEIDDTKILVILKNAKEKKLLDEMILNLIEEMMCI